MSPFQGISIDFTETDGLGELPPDLLEVSLEEVLLTFESVDPPAAIWFRVTRTSDEDIHRSSLPLLGLLHLLGTNVARINRAWVYDRRDNFVEFVEARDLHMPLRGQGEFFLPVGVAEDALKAAHERITTALKRATWLRTSLEHYLLALDRNGLSRGLLDMTIALESLIRSTTEVSFRLSNQIPRVVTTAPSEWDEWGDLLRDLYDVRSKHVHGASPSRKTQAVAAKFSDLVELMRAAIIYALDYHSIEPPAPDRWDRHLGKLLTATTVKLSPEWRVQ